MQSLNTSELFQLYKNSINPQIDPALVPFLPDLRNAQGQGLLHVANDAAAVEFLLSAGLDPNLADSRGRTPLMRLHSADNNRLLIQAGADVNQCDENGDTVLDHQTGSLLCCVGYCGPDYPALELLLESGAHPPSPERAKLWIETARHQVCSALENNECQGFEKWVAGLLDRCR